MMSRIGSKLVVLVSVILFIRILDYSWVTDDAFITFRSVMNFVSGYGPVFNIEERVQSFTHPLWFFFLSAGGFLDLNLYFFAIILGLFFSLFTVVALYRLNRELGNENNNIMLLLAFGYLAASESFVTFGTSGLENSLTYFLVTATIIASLKYSRRLAFYFLVSLTLLNRFDAIFFLTPLFLWVNYTDWRSHKMSVKKIAVGFLPLVGWHAFSLVYYGFIFPNTKYAKIGGRSLIDNTISGLHYLADSIQSELHVWLLIVLLPVLMFVTVRGRVLRTSHNHIFAAIISGIYLQIAYVVFISGGDFMRGRFFTIVVLGAAISLLFIRFAVSPLYKGLLVLICVCIFSASAWIGAKEKLLWPAPGVANERNFYKQTLALNLDPQKNYTNHPWAIQARELASSTRTKGVIGVNGQRAYWVPRNINLVDPVALTDAFIARLPIVDSHRTGHFERKIPEEYLAIKIQHHNVKEWKDAGAQKLYDNLRIVTESKTLFTTERLKAMFWLWRRYGI